MMVMAASLRRRNSFNMFLGFGGAVILLSLIEPSTSSSLASTLEDRTASLVVDPSWTEGKTTDPLTVSALTAKDNNDDEDDEMSETPYSPDLACGIWLASSTIPGAGLGIYAGKDFSHHEELLGGVGDAVVALIDIPSNQALYNRELGRADDDYQFLWDEYTWSATTLHMHMEALHECSAASPGFGAATNAFLALTNIEEWLPENDAAGLHRQKDPGAGAFTTFHNRKVTAEQDIAAGQELFVSYGESWFTTRPGMGPIPLYRHLKDADKLVEQFSKMQDFVHHHHQQQQHHSLDASVGSSSADSLSPDQMHRNSTQPAEVLQDLWDTFIRHSKFTQSRVFGSFRHHDPEELEQLQETSLEDLRREQTTRSVEWLRQYGGCGDHLTVGRSTLPQAGRGALARRFLPAGTLVAPMPMIHIPDRERLRMYHLETDDVNLRNKVRGYQLLLNYCFGHAESSLLLCPYSTLSVHINHNQTLANVRLQWSDPQRGNHNPALLEQPLETLETDSRSKLAMELLATRDIQEGEEIFMDYGDAWEAAWQHHVATWQPVPGADTYVAAWQLNQDQSSRMRTSFEQLEQPYPANLQLLCDSTFTDPGWERHVFAGTLQEYLDSKSGSWWECDILSVMELKDRYFYKVVIIEPADEEEEEEEGGRQNVAKDHLVNKVPREAFHFLDRPYTSDAFLPNAFRHDIRIPDELFPVIWRNLRPAETPVHPEANPITVVEELT